MRRVSTQDPGGAWTKGARGSGGESGGGAESGDRTTTASREHRQDRVDEAFHLVHELRRSLASIELYTDLARGACKRASLLEPAQDLDEVLRSTRTLDFVLGQYARAEAARSGRLEPSLGCVAVEDLLESLERALAERVPGLEVRTVVLGEGAVVRTDAGLLELTLADLAAEATRRLGPRARLRIAVEPGMDSGYVEWRMAWGDECEDASGASGAAEHGSEPLDPGSLAARAARAVLPLLGAELTLYADHPRLALRSPSEHAAPRSPDSPYTSAAEAPDETHHVDAQPEPGAAP